MSMPIVPTGSSVDVEDWETQTELNPRSNVFVPNRTEVPLPPSRMVPTTILVDENNAQNEFDEWTRTPSGPSAARTTACGWDQNRQIWEAANTPAPLMYSHNFPSLHDGSNSTFARRSTGPSPVFNPPYTPQYGMYLNPNTNFSIPPGTVSQSSPTPKITLLKRPTNSTNNSPGGSRGTTPPAGAGRSLTEREEEYRKARERIFATGTTDSGTKPSRGSGDGSKNHNAAKEGNGGSSSIHRQPTGPSANGSSGFGSNSSSRSGSGRGRPRG
ncbi:SUZ domain [Phaffia rhodozyma]|uniref:SUZ domain n=1 Tax=Phaffia rhodozyma TaxID=264483 RepID=A0A0F7SSH4_PHARH|nr:SUZ domain [Phaffia rhodozyma]